MFSVRIITTNPDTGMMWQGRDYYELFDAQTVAEIEAQNIVKMGGTVDQRWCHSFLYALVNLMGEKIEIVVLDTSTNNPQPLRELVTA